MRPLLPLVPLRAARTATAARIAVAALVAAFAGPASAIVYPGMRAPAVRIEQHLGARLPLATPFVDAAGRAVRLGNYFGEAAAVPVVLVLGYYHCPNLCQTVMEGTIEALAQSRLPRSAYRIVAVSIDPEENAADADARRRIDLQIADLARARVPGAPDGDGPLSLAALVGSPASIAAVAASAGFVFERSADPRSGAAGSAFAHAAGFLVATPDGRISRYFLGVRHDPAAVRAAVDAAAGRSIGGLVDELVLLCAHLDPTAGRFDTAVMTAMRALGLALAAALGLWIWRRRRPPEGART